MNIKRLNVSRSYYPNQGLLHETILAERDTTEIIHEISKDQQSRFFNDKLDEIIPLEESPDLQKEEVAFNEDEEL